jgi:putative glutamine amidotransferase
VTRHETSVPVVGVTGYRGRAVHGLWDENSDLLPTIYAEGVRRAGGIPVVLPPNVPYGPSARSVLARIDALVIAGGSDVDPAAYREEAHPRSGPFNDERDSWELALLDAALERGLPTLGICRGMQVMAVHAGGALHQHVPEVVGHEGHDPGGPAYGSTLVTIDRAGTVGRLLGERAVVPCHHHQSVREHPGFTATAWAQDGTIEAFERTDGVGHPFFLGVQWHPEASEELGLFQGLVEAARG